MSDAPDRPPKRRLIPRFSLRLLLVAITALCLIAGYWVYRAGVQRAAVELLCDEGYTVTYDLHEAPDGLRARLAPYLGADYVSAPIMLFCNASSRDNHGALETVAKLRRTRMLTLDFSRVDDDDLKALRGMPHLDFLMLSHTAVTDAGITYLVDCPLQTFHLDGLRLTDACVEDLARLSELRLLTLPERGISDAGIEKLKAALPGCEIRRED